MISQNKETYRKMQLLWVTCFVLWLTYFQILILIDVLRRTREMFTYTTPSSANEARDLCRKPAWAGFDTTAFASVTASTKLSRSEPPHLQPRHQQIHLDRMTVLQLLFCLELPLLKTVIQSYLDGLHFYH